MTAVLVRIPAAARLDRGRPGDQWGPLDPTVLDRLPRRSFDELLAELAGRGAPHAPVGYL